MIPVIHFKQSQGFCGPASLKIVLSYYGEQKSEDELAILCHTTRQTGTEPQDIVAAAQSLGFTATYKKNSSLDELRTLVEKQIPVIVDWFSPEENGHYCVVIGFEKDEIILSDPLFGDIRRLDATQFLNRWFEVDTYPPQHPAHFSLREIIVITRQ